MRSLARRSTCSTTSHCSRSLEGSRQLVLTQHVGTISANTQREQREAIFVNPEAFFAGRSVLAPVPDWLATWTSR